MSTPPPLQSNEHPIPVDKNPYLLFAHTGTDWKGHHSLKNVVVFGDSYSDCGHETGEHHSEADPNSTSFWVDILTSPDMKLNNFAVSGATAEHDLDDQLDEFFASFPTTKSKSPSAPVLNPAETTYILFMGINDCGRTPANALNSLVGVLFDAIHRLYIEAGARNFVVVDVPPIDRSPAVRSLRSGATVQFKHRVETWNQSLLRHAPDFVSRNKQATLLVFSSNKALAEVLDKPGAYGFAENDVDVEGGGIWQDSLHITPEVHEVFAACMASALEF